MKKTILLTAFVIFGLVNYAQTMHIDKVIQNATIDLTLHSERTSINLHDSIIEFQYTMKIYLKDTVSVGEIRDQLRMKYTDLGNPDAIFWNTMKYLLELSETDYTFTE